MKIKIYFNYEDYSNKSNPQDINVLVTESNLDKFEFSDELKSKLGVTKLPKQYNADIFIPGIKKPIKYPNKIIGIYEFSSESYEMPEEELSRVNEFISNYITKED